jgi:hypothetical protein
MTAVNRPVITIFEKAGGPSLSISSGISKNPDGQALPAGRLSFSRYGEL